jgi:hypothetical protein
VMLFQFCQCTGKGAVDNTVQCTAVTISCVVYVLSSASNNTDLNRQLGGGGGVTQGESKI